MIQEADTKVTEKKVKGGTKSVAGELGGYPEEGAEEEEDVGLLRVGEGGALGVAGDQGLLVVARGH